MWLQHVRTTIRRAVLALAAVQFTTMIVLLLIDTWRKKERKPVVFPKTPPVPIDTGGTQVTVYTYGQDLYDDMLAAIDAATEQVLFETFIWKHDSIGHQFKQALIRAAERGVEVYVIFDEFANLVIPREFFHLPDIIHVQRHPLVSGGWKFWHPRHSGRDHRKLMVVDTTVAFIGGYNIGSLYATDWRDTHVRVTGDAVLELENAFIDFWNMRPSKRRPVLHDPHPRNWFSPVRVHRNVPRLLVYPIRYMYLEAIDRAHQRIWLTHAYLIPDEGLIRGLITAVDRGVDVRIIVPERSNHIVADWLSRGFYRQLLSGGVRLFLYRGAMVHAKTAVIDNAWSTIGTANLDALSLIGNYEINLEVSNTALAAKMNEVFELDLTNCRELTLAQWESRSLLVKFSEAILKPLGPLF